MGYRKDIHLMKPKYDINFEPEKHEYWYEGLLIPNYSSIVGCVFGNKFENVPDHILEAKRILGSRVHKMAEMYDLGETFEVEDLGSYLKQWILFQKDFEIIDKDFSVIEEPLFSKKNWFCCTPDRITSGGTLIDIKTGKKYKEHRLQTACQKIAVEENYNIKVKQRICIYLTPDTYKVDIHENDNDLKYWEGILNTFKWKMFEK